MKSSIFRKAAIIISFAAVFSSCSKALLLEDYSTGLNGNTGKLIIKGIISDVDTFTPIVGILVSFQCSQEDFEKITEYTDERGIYTIIANGFTQSITGCITAKDPNDIYSSTSREIMVNWKGEAYDPVTSSFVVNDCNFQLQKK
ncbi:MAG: hypothetical protein ACI3ZL_07185 [Candidatus Cryptobacteroides sp.]